MAGTSASLVVRISADINDFQKQLNSMTRDVDRAAAKLESVGKALTVGITLPVIAATAKLAQMAAENEDIGARFERVYGSMAASVNASIKTMMKSVPEAETDLQRMAISIDNMALGLGLAPKKAATMSASLLKLAGDASAFAHVPMSEALEAIEKGLAGKTKGLLQFGIAVKEADVKQRAYQMGLVGTGQELTATGTALASYSLIMEHAARINGEAERTAGQAGKSFQFLKRDVGELADHVSGLVLPSVSALAKSLDSIVLAADKVDHETVKMFFELAAKAALVGPLIIVVAKLTDGVMKMKAAFAILSAGREVSGFFVALTSPLGIALTGVVALTTALGGLYTAWKKFTDEKNTAPIVDRSAFQSPLMAIPGASSVVAIGAALDAWREHRKTTTADTNALPPGLAAPVTFRALGTKAPALTASELDDATSRMTGTPLEQFKTRADEITQGFDNALAHGRPIAPMLTGINALHREAASLLAAQGGTFNKNAEAAQGVLDKVQAISRAIAFANASGAQQQELLARMAKRDLSAFNPTLAASQEVVQDNTTRTQQQAQGFARLGMKDFFDNPTNVSNQALLQNGQDERAARNALALREELLKLPHAFDAVRTAVVEAGESARQYADDLKKRLVQSLMPSTRDIPTEARINSKNAVKSFDEDIKARQAALRLTDGFDAAREAAVQYGEAQRKYREELDTRFALSQKPSTFDAGTEAQTQSNNAVKSFKDDIALRQSLLTLPDGFNAADLAAVQFAESQRSVTESVALQYEHLRLNLDQFGIHLGNMSERMQVVTLSIAQAAIAFAQTLVANAGGSGKGASLGRGLGGLAGMIAGSLLGPGGTAAGAMIGGAIGTVVGTGIGGVIGGAFDGAADSTNRASDSMTTLAKTVNAVTESITNVPAWFKVATYRFEAAPIINQQAPPPKNPNPALPTGSTGGSGGSTGGSGGNGNPNGGQGSQLNISAGRPIVIQGDVIVHGVTDPKSLLDKLQEAAFGRQSTGAAGLTYAFGGALK